MNFIRTFSSIKGRPVGLFRVFFAVVSIAVVTTTAFAQREYSIAQIQGKGNVSPLNNQQVKTSGVVTARTRNGFFIQTPDEKIDSDPATSEGVFVFTRTEPGSDAAIGNLITVTGQVMEFKPRTDPNTLTITQVSMNANRDTMIVVSRENPLPKPIVLTATDMSANQIDQLERFEGMRVTVAELIVTAATRGRVDNVNDLVVSEGVFYGVPKGMERPFREPGFDSYEFLFLSSKEQADFRKNFGKIRIFDSNPERLRIESSAQLGGQPINLPALTELKNVTGVMNYAFRTYSILLDVTGRPSVASYPRALQMPAPKSDQFTIAGMNIENFVDDIDDPNIKENIATTEAFEKRIRKISLAVRRILNSPEIMATMETENVEALKRLAARINSDTVAEGKPDPKYDAVLLKGNGDRGQNLGYIYKSTRVKVVGTELIDKDLKFNSPQALDELFLHDRPSFVLRAEVMDDKGERKFPITLINHHLKSFLGYYDPKRRDGVRLKKRLQAESIARYIDQRQKADPKERIMLIGDFNAFQFNDGIVDVIGTLKGTPAPAGEVVNPSPDLIETDLINLVDLIKPSERYSYIFDGNAQVLDHAIVSANLRPFVALFGYARGNADYPGVNRNDETRPERFSDHDSPIVYINFAKTGE